MPTQAQETDCSDNIDNDCDGFTDCQDASCADRMCSTTSPGNICTVQGANGCQCSVIDTPITAALVQTAVVDVGGRPRALASGVAGIDYFQCAGSCSSVSPSWADPIHLGSNNGAAQRPVLLANDAGALTAAFREQTDAGSRPIYMECVSGDCTDAGSWSFYGVTPPGVAADDLPVDMDHLPPQRAIVFNRIDGAAIWAECSSLCTIGSGWRTIVLPIANSGSGSGKPTVALSRDARRAFFGNTYAECPASNLNCPDAGWVTATLPTTLIDPDMVLDSNSLPRIFSTVGVASNQAIVLTRCTTMPCTNAANWSSMPLTPAAGSPLAGVTADGRTWFIAGTGLTSATPIKVGIELPTGGYAIRALTDCTNGLFSIDEPSGYPGPFDRWRVLHSTNPLLRLDWEQP